MPAEKFETRVAQALEQNIFGVGDLLNHWPAFIRRQEFPRFFSHYEIFKLVETTPGSIVEVGVYKGASFFTWAALLDTFCPFDQSRLVYGFEWFQGLKSFGEYDNTQAPEATVPYAARREGLELLLQLHASDSITGNFQRCQLIDGNIHETLPHFLREHSGLRISLLHLDLDLYEPTRYALAQLYPFITPGGVVCCDQYGLPQWAGESRAVDEFLTGLNADICLKKHSFAHSPGAYWVKK